MNYVSRTAAVHCSHIFRNFEGRASSVSYLLSSVILFNASKKTYIHINITTLDPGCRKKFSSLTSAKLYF